MKRIIFFICIVLMSLLLQKLNYCFGEDKKNSCQNSKNYMTVGQLYDLDDDKIIVSYGRIIRNEYSDYYTFTDGEDNILASIDDSVFLGRAFSPETMICIHGKYDEMTRTIIVKKIDIF